jgi:hypothetical protein
VNKISILFVLACLSACASPPQADQSVAAAPACQNLEAATGSNRLTRGKCVTIDPRDQDAARALTEQLQMDQFQRNLPRPGTSN